MLDRAISIWLDVQGFIVARSALATKNLTNDLLHSMTEEKQPENRLIVASSCEMGTLSVDFSETSSFFWKVI